MTLFDWPRFLDQNRIDHRTISDREVLCQCPWCGHNDPSKHMSINLQGRGWKCFRSDEHKGRNPTRLIQAMLGCSMEHAASLCGSSIQLGDDFKSQLAKILDVVKFIKAKPPAMPKEFLPLADKPSAWPFLSHLRGRGFRHSDTLKLARKYDLRYCKSGVYQGRIIFPVKRSNQLMTWTGRTITSDPARYRSHTTDTELAKKLDMEPAAESISNLLLWHDELLTTKADILVICEGPMDALKVNHLGNRQGIISTCLFTMRASSAQIFALQDLLPKFRRSILLLDRGTLSQSISILMKMPQLEIMTLPKDVSDPGELSPENFFLLGLDH